MESMNVKSVFKVNRAEELGLDVWNDFVVPLFYDDIDILDAGKPRRITGGRGSGKTMLLRYLSHYSQFSTSRQESDGFNLDFIGLYWRADTNFLTMFNKQGVDQEVWIKLFRHYMVLTISSEVISSLMSIAKSNFQGLSLSSLESMRFSELLDYDKEIPVDYNGLKKYIRRKLRECESAVHNPKEIMDLKFIPDSFLIDGVIQSVRDDFECFSETSFCIFVDEYENLLEYQQMVINTQIKHSQRPLIYHIAMKKNGMDTPKTLGSESIQGIADYRNFDLDELLVNSNFEVFSAELFLSRLYSKIGDYEFLASFDLKILQDPARISDRLSIEYRRSVVSLVDKILPGMSYSQMAKEALSSSSHYNKLKKDIDISLTAVGETGIKSEQFLVDGFERGSIIIPALLARKSNSPALVFKEYLKYVSGEKSNFDSWISNNFVGCYLQMYRTYDRICPFYAGFNTYVALSSGNVRHFYELCNAAMIRSDISKTNLVIDVNIQVLAARSASEEILNEAPAYGKFGAKIRAFIYNIGHIFEFSHMRKTQSESEINHFSIRGGFSSLDEEDVKFLSEAEKWGVLYQEKSTKGKDKSNPDNSDWILNPIYSPFFFISYRKKKKIDFSPEEFKILHSGSEDSRMDLERLYKSKWELEDLDQPYSHKLF
jgi:hypothetical protein